MEGSVAHARVLQRSDLSHQPSAPLVCDGPSPAVVSAFKPSCGSRATAASPVGVQAEFSSLSPSGVDSEVNGSTGMAVQLCVQPRIMSPRTSLLITQQAVPLLGQECIEDYHLCSTSQVRRGDVRTEFEAHMKQTVSSGSIHPPASPDGPTAADAEARVMPAREFRSASTRSS